MTRRLIGVKVKDKEEEEQKVREDRLQLKDCRQYILVNNYGYYIYLGRGEEEQDDEEFGHAWVWCLSLFSRLELNMNYN